MRRYTVQDLSGYLPPGAKLEDRKRDVLYTWQFPDGGAEATIERLLRRLRRQSPMLASHVKRDVRSTTSKSKGSGSTQQQQQQRDDQPGDSKLQAQVYLLLDDSGSMSGEKLLAARQQAQTILNELGNTQTSVTLFGENISIGPFQPASKISLTRYGASQGSTRLSQQTAINPLDIPSVTRYNQLMLSTLRRWFKHLCYWFRTHTYNRYHILDLKRAEPENPDGYRWGWTDRCYSLVLANFLVLRDFVEQEKPWSCAEYIAELEANGDPNGELPSLRKQQADYEECMLLYRWWVKDRFDEYRDFEQREVETFERFKKTGNESDREAWFAADLAKEKRNNEMLHRLIALRGYLWT